MKNNLVEEQPNRKLISAIRVSSKPQGKEDRTGIPRQLEDVETTCIRHGAEVVKEFRFTGLSGAHVQNSRRFKEMLTELSKPEISGLVIATLDRFFRPENLSAYQVFQPFEFTGKHLFCELGELDPSNSQDQMKIVIWGQQAGLERERMKDRMVRGKNKNRYEPQIKSDTLPDGIFYDKASKLFSYTAAAQRVERAMKRVLRRDSLASIAHDLGWTSTTALRATLKSYWWIGVKACVNKRVDKKWDEKRDQMSDGRRVPREQPIMVETNLASSPLVSKKMFYAVQDILKHNRKQWTQRRSRSNNFLCSGLLYCECGKKMYHKVDVRPGRPSYYLCSTNYNKQTRCGYNMMEAHRADREVWTDIMFYTKSRKYLREQVNAALSEHRQDEKRQSVNDIERVVNTLKKRKENIIKTIEYSGFSPHLAERQKALDNEITEANMRLAEAMDQITEMRAINPEDIARRINERFWKRGNLTLIQRKALLAEMVERIILVTEPGEECTRIRFKVPADAIMQIRAIRHAGRP
ncbi:MAG: recombinase family protein [Bryobacteraceae bacterium]